MKRFLKPFAASTLALIAALPALAAGTWQSSSVVNPTTGVANPGRYAPVATYIPTISGVARSGKVLVAGGYSQSVKDTLTSAFLYDPATMTFTATGSLSVSRNHSTATLLSAGRVMVAGGFKEYYGTQTVVDIYDPAKGTFTKQRYGLTTARELHTATTLDDGRVLMTGGFKTGYGGGSLRSAEIYTPSTARFTSSSTMVMQTPYGRFGHEAILLPGRNQVLVVGGKERGPNNVWRSLRSIELYDVATARFHTVGQMKWTRDRPQLAWVDSLKRVLIVGGKSEGTGEVYGTPVECEWFDPAQMDKGLNPVSLGPSLAAGRMAHTLTSLGTDKFVVVGGWCQELFGGRGATTHTAERFVLDTALPTGGYFAVEPSTSRARQDAAAVALPGGKVGVFFGAEVLRNPDLTQAAPDYSETIHHLNDAEIYMP